MGLSQDNGVQGYINEVCSQIRFRAIHPDIKLELETHIQELVQEYLIQGISKDEAIEQAILQMGDAHIVGQQLDKVHKPYPEWSVLFLSFLFINMGLGAVYFIEKQGLLPHGIPVFNRGLVFSLIGIVFIIGLIFFDYRKLEKHSGSIYLGALALLIITMLWGDQVAGSRSWLRLGGFNVNAVAVSPVLFTVALAGIFNQWDWNNTFKFLQGLALILFPLVLILSAPSISAGVIYLVACLVLVIGSGLKTKKIVAVVATIMLPALFFFILAAPHRLARLFIFLNPGSDPRGTGYLNLQLSKTIAEAGFLGQRLTFSNQTLPELHTDFIFAFVTYTFGWLASALVIVLTVLFLVRIASIAKQVKTNYGKLLVSAFTAVLTVQFFWHILMNLGLAPISGVGLPLVSYGGSQLIIDAAIVGLALSVYRRRSISQNRQPL